ncbi:Na+ dependent nucleoside transporter N-terminal domain-containing protein [Candidatus Midichloria mitochondrii]|uniref:Na+ dependent nucleoside transporter N-terminal domain-containing protein n=1 Tax=Candidatus Midichloria mitochondrii TaxID=234827 RepID=UPI000696BCCE
MLERFFAIFCFYLIAWVLSEDKKSFSWKVLISGVFFQFIIVAFLIEMPAASSPLLVISMGCRQSLILPLRP